MQESGPVPDDAILERLADGHAALWLCESLILTLVNNGTIEKEQMLEAVEIVIAAKRGSGLRSKEPDLAAASIALLAEISTSVAAAKPATMRPFERGRSPRKPRRRTSPVQ